MWYALVSYSYLREIRRTFHENAVNGFVYPTELFYVKTLLSLCGLIAVAFK